MKPPLPQDVRKGGALFDLLPRAFLILKGKDRVPFLHNLVSHDIKGLPPGQGRAACLLDRQGKIQFFALVHARPEELWLEMEPDSLAPARALLEKYRISEAVEFEAPSPPLKAIPLHGPRVPELVGRIWPSLNLPTTSFHHAPGPEGSGFKLAVRWDLFRMPGIHLWVSPEEELALRQRIGREAAGTGVEAGDRELFETLRIESGLPWPGKEITPEVILNELGSEESVSFTKGCFVGQEIVARIKYRAHPPRLLTGFLLEGKEAPSTPCPIHQEGQEVGLLTSACLSPTLDRVIGLGFLRYGLEGSNLRAAWLGREISATTAQLPFV